MFIFLSIMGQKVWADTPQHTKGSRSSSQLLPPKVLEQVNAQYPAEEFTQHRGGVVELSVTILANGQVGEVTVLKSAGAAFDQAAIQAMRQWKFIPAKNGNVRVISRIKVPFTFTPPPQVPSKQTVEDRSSLPSDQIKTVNDSKTEKKEDHSIEDVPIEVTVQGSRALRVQQRSSSDFTVTQEILSLSPKQEGTEVLRAAPGLYIGRGEGPAVAHNYMLRGFDAEHGQDIEFNVGGLPINLPSHIHGQGYSDLGFLVSEVVQELNVSEGVYDPRQGDFAVAGSLRLKLGVDPAQQGLVLRTSYGDFNSSRHLLIWSPESTSNETFVAAQLNRSDGFGINRAGQAGSIIAQHRFGHGEITHRVMSILYIARSDLAGVLRLDDIDRTLDPDSTGKNGKQCWTCSYPVPTAQSQNALTNRLMFGMFSDYQGQKGDNGQLGLWVSYDLFQLQSNYTGFIQTSQLLERVGGRGDLIGQQNHTFTLGLTGRYRAPSFHVFPWLQGKIELGVDGRVDEINQGQNLLDATVRNQVWDRTVDATINSADLGVWGDLDLSIWEPLKVRVGFRSDLLSFNVNDRLSNFPPLTRPQNNFIPGYRRSAMGLAVGPRASIEWQVNQDLTALIAYGEGYRSPQARTLEDGESAPFSKVHSADLGLRYQKDRVLELTLGGYATYLSDDIAFEASEGRLERIGATQRYGAVFHVLSRPFTWLIGTLSATYVNATLLEPPPATAEEPQPFFVEGQQLPFVPPLVIRADIGTQNTLLNHLAGSPLRLSTGVGVSHLSPRPLPFDERSAAVSLLDVSTTLSWGIFELSFELYNALDLQYAALEYSYPSDWQPNDGLRPRTPARHISAGAPRIWMISLGISGMGGAQ